MKLTSKSNKVDVIKLCIILCFLPTQSVHFCMTIKHAEINGIFDYKENFKKNVLRENTQKSQN